MTDYNIIRATSADEDRVFQFLAENFYADEPLNRSVNYPGPRLKKDCVSPVILKENMSFIAVLKNDPNVICGATINKLIRNEDNRDLWEELADNNRGTPYEKILRFLCVINTNFIQILREHCWENTNTNTALDTTIIAAGKNFRGKGIAERLTEHTIALAKEKGHRWLTMECSSAYSAKLCRKLAYKSVLKQVYSEYKDEEGNIIFNTEEPHYAFESFVKEIHS